MSRSLSSLVKRRKTIETTQKITNAMKLVSMSKLQRYRSRMLSYNPIYEHILNLPKEAAECKKSILYVAFVPDLGLVSAYPRNLLNELHKLDDGKLIVIGSQSFEKFESIETLELLNSKISSENIDFDMIRDFIQKYEKDYEIYCLVPEVSMSAKLEFEVIETCYKLKNEYDMVFEPNYELANKSFKKVFLEATLIDAYYKSKVAEYTMRRVAMEQATENADEMLYELKLQYNRLRQEKITEEIADLTQAED